jgi:hypothetical protein
MIETIFSDPREFKPIEIPVATCEVASYLQKLGDEII